MNDIAMDMSGDLADELASNARRAPVDSRTMPARFSNLKAVGQSPAHGLASFQDERAFDTLATRIGSGTHAMLFAQPLVQWTGKVRNGKVWDAFKLEHAGKVILSGKEYAKATAMSAAIVQHPIASRILFGADVAHERTLLWEQLGRKRRSTPDAFSKTMVAELKTTRCAEPGRFNRDAVFRAYHAQLADQCNAIEQLHGYKPKSAYIVAVESVEPYAVTVMQLTERALDRGASLCRLWLERLIVSETTGLWPSYCESIEPFDVMDDVELTFGDESADTEAA